METTKQRIIKEALLLFAKRGFDSVSVVDIAQSVGIKAPSLYKHFKTKQAIFDAIIEACMERYKKQTIQLQMERQYTKEEATFFYNIDSKKLIELGKGLFLYFLKDSYSVNFRKMLMIEQFHNPAIARLYQQHFIEGPLNYQTALFTSLIEMGKFKKLDPQIMAYHFYTPLLTLLTYCDEHSNREEEALILMEKHITQFNLLYLNKED